MLELPYDLQIQILRFLERRGLWSLSQTCQHLRQVATAELLSQYDIPKSQIESGSISLTEDAAFLIPAIHRFHPIHTITIFPRRDCSYPSNVSLERVPAILASLSPKPETVIRADAVFNEPTQHVDQLLNTYSRQGRDPIAIVDSGKIWVSSARVRPPLQKSLLHYNFTRHLREGEGVFSFITALPMMIFWTAIQLINAFRALFWLSCGWSQTVRISEDIQSHSGHSLSVKTLLTDQDSQFTLATFNHDSTQFSALSFPALPSLSCQQTSALLAALSLPHVAQLTVEEGSALDLGALLEFMQRHSSLTRLTLEHHAIGSTSFSTSLTTQSVGAQHHTSHNSHCH
ncbi:hypothetical protein R3P38DRAFT_2968201 [Favolaschia claudopus]|uniref:F-box domain-containing protein n=1 Tax=Favolaschia claudopus TaxID=2862362 RepID=A0AAW0B6G0_9AGAR